MAADDSERRLAAILSGDVVGYSRLVADDEAATIQAIHSARELVEACAVRHRGRLADFTGDNFLAELPAARNAVECALEIQRELEKRNAGVPEARRLRFRIGAHLGDVVSAEGRLFGDGVNVAARLEPLAEPGGLCLSGAVADQVRGKLTLTYQDLGERALKNIAAPVRAFRVRADGSAPAPLPRAPRMSSRRRLVALVFAAALAAVVIGIGWPRLGALMDRFAAAPAPGSNPAIAVLPFENLSSDPDDAFLGPGLAEALLTQLASQPRLRVVASTSAVAIPESERDPRAIGRRLGVRYLLVGSVRRSGERMRTTARLIDSSNGSQLWSFNFDRKLADIFAVEDEVAARVAEALLETLGGSDPRRTIKRPESLDAYLAYLSGRTRLARYRGADTQAAIADFQRALKLEPDYALAMVGLVEARLRLVYEPSKKSWAEQRPLIERALALDGSLGEAWVLKGVEEADEALIEKGLALAPSFGPGFMWYAEFLSENDRTAEALAMAERAKRVDPLSPRNYYFVGLMHMYTDEPDKAEAAFIETLSIDAAFQPALFRLSELDYERGHWARAVKLAEQSIALEPSSGMPRQFAAWAYLALGELETMRALIDSRFTEHLLAAAIYEDDLAQMTARVDNAPPVEAGIAAAAILRIWVRSGDPSAALRRLDAMYPENPSNADADQPLWARVARAELLIAQGERAEAVRRLGALVKETAAACGDRIESSAHRPCLERAAALALCGDSDAALTLLESIYATGFTGSAWLDFERRSAFAGLRGNPRFAALRERYASQLARERSELAAMRARGEVPAAPSLAAPRTLPRAL